VCIICKSLLEVSVGLERIDIRGEGIVLWREIKYDKSSTTTQNLTNGRGEGRVISFHKSPKHNFTISGVGRGGGG
jgi:hypothetical protein